MLRTLEMNSILSALRKKQGRVRALQKSEVVRMQLNGEFRRVFNLRTGFFYCGFNKFRRDRKAEGKALGGLESE